MNSFDYRVYYEYNGATICNPLRSKKNDNEISSALENFPNDLPHHLSDQHATVYDDPTKRDGNSITIKVTTSHTETETDNAVKQCLNCFDLFGTKLVRE